MPAPAALRVYELGGKSVRPVGNLGRALKGVSAIFSLTRSTGRHTGWLFVLVLSAFALRAAEPVPLVRAHAHNDYEHPRPLFDALERGFGSIEADVWLVEGQLLVAHHAKDVKPGRTLTTLYLEPLRERVRRNGGRVYPGGPPLVLLVDVKSAAAPTYAVLHELLQTYAEMLTVFRADAVETRAVTVIVSGNRAREEMLAQPVRYAALDGRRGDLETNPPATMVPWVSENWRTLFTWRWEGTMPAEEEAALRAYVKRAHAQGRRVRFWNTPDRPEAWRLLTAIGVDLIGTDDLAGLAQFLETERRR